MMGRVLRVTEPRKVRGKVPDLTLRVVDVGERMATAQTKYGFAKWVKGYTLTEWLCSNCGTFIARGYGERAWRLLDPHTTLEASLRLCTHCMRGSSRPES